MRSTLALNYPNSRPRRDKVLLSSCTYFALVLVSLTGSLTQTSSSCVISLLKLVNNSEYLGSRYCITKQLTFLFSIFLRLFSWPKTIFKKEFSSTGSLLQILVTLSSRVEMRLQSILSQNCYRFLVAKPLQMDMVVYQFYTIEIIQIANTLYNLLELIIKQREIMRHDRNAFQQQASDKENHDRSAVNFMRENIRELNRSMESIEKMIEKSRRLIHQSREASLGRNSLEKAKDNRREGALLESCRKNNQEITYVTSGKNEKKAPAYRQINLKKSNNAEEKSGAASEKKQNVLIRSQQDHRKQEREIVSSKSKERSRMESPFKETFEHGKAIYKFSPQRTQNLHFRQSKSKQKSPDQPNIKIKPKTAQVPIQPSKPQPPKLQASQKSASNIKENILIEQEDASNQYNTPNANKYEQKQYRFKTDYTCQESTDIYKMYKLDEPQSTFQPKPEKRKINLKLFQSDIKKSCLVSQRSKKSTIQSIKLSTRKNLVRELQQLQTASKNDEERKAKFILKIKKYGFVEKHLSKEQIWSIYDQLIEANVPELKWPIVIVDQVYSKMKMYK